MSLINDALKKAQHQRAEAAAAQGAAGSTSRRPKIPRGQLALVLTAAAAVLIVFSVVITVYLVNREPSVSRPAIVATPKAPPSSATAAPSPVLVAPVITPPAAAQGSAPAGTAVLPASPAATAGTVVPASTSVAVVQPAMPPSSAAPAPVTSAGASTPPGSTPPAPAAPAGPDARAQAFVDAIRVTGIRSSGTDSKVLMNDHVYRLDEIVERSLGLKLVKVDADMLTFTDPAGHTYTKRF